MAIRKVQKQKEDWKTNKGTRYLFVAAQKWIEQHKQEFEELGEEESQVNISMTMENNVDTPVRESFDLLGDNEKSAKPKERKKDNNENLKIARIISKRKMREVDEDLEEEEEEEDNNENLIATSMITKRKTREVNEDQEEEEDNNENSKIARMISERKTRAVDNDLEEEQDFEKENRSYFLELLKRKGKKNRKYEDYIIS
eukprot:TRINITY_DN3051_c0_g1_i4.p4 TRINITY_DN3051_c0_g1~~TRINITY_DN3051_c0_g1_i4.p4  ORF type:complete len:200 (+),score=56.39 TRINITY_DN3051_c0_g1_i4:151-750(+)